VADKRLTPLTPNDEFGRSFRATCACHWRATRDAFHPGFARRLLHPLLHQYGGLISFSSANRMNLNSEFGRGRGDYLNSRLELGSGVLDLIRDELLPA
jgi:hypothetical protein